MIVPSRHQPNFSAGEISPTAQARIDYEGYFKATKRSKNVTILLRGGLSRRFGTEFCGFVSNTKLRTEVKVYSFKIGIYSYYSLVLMPGEIHIYYERNLVAEIENPFLRQDIKDVKISQLGDDIFMHHENYQTKVISRAPSPGISISGLGATEENSLSTPFLGIDVGVVVPVKFSASSDFPETSPVIDDVGIYFIRAVTRFDFSIYETPDDARLDKNRFVVTSSGSGASVIFQNEWSVSNFSFKVQPTVDYARDYFNETFSFNSTGNILTCSGSVFRDEHVGGLFKFPFAADIDRLVGRITEVNSATEAVLDGDWTKSPSGLLGSECFLNEVAFSDVRGWPRTSTDYENRFFIGGNKVLPGVSWGSTTNNEENFDDSDASDTSSISLSTSKNSGQALYLVGTKSLLIFTNSGIYSTGVNTSQPLTPNNRKIVQVSNYGIEDVPVIEMDGLVFYVPSGGKSIDMIVFDINQNGYTPITISKISDHLIKSPVSASALSGSDKTDINYIFYVNEDGTMAILNIDTDRGENISGFTEAVTDGDFLDVSASDGNCYVLTRRDIAGEANICVEFVDFDLLTDSAKKFSFSSPVSFITDLYHLEGETVKVIADGYRYESDVVDGVLDLNEPASEVEVGRSFTVEIQPVDFVIPDSGNYIYSNKQYKKIYIRYYNSFGIKLNGDEIPDLSFSNQEIDQAPQVKTGVYRWSPRTNLTYDAHLSITQDEPYPLTILALGFEVQ